MGFVNLPPDLYAMFRELNRRIESLEKSNRFTAPNVPTDPTNHRPGDVWFNQTSNLLKAVDINGTIKTITWS